MQNIKDFRSQGSLREATAPEVGGGGGQRVSQTPKDFRNTVCRVSQGTLSSPAEKGLTPMLEAVLKGQDHSVTKRQALEPESRDPHKSHYY